MTQTPDVPMQVGEIYARMSKAMAAVGSVAKSHRNKEQNYDFRSIDDMYDAVQPALVENGIFPVPTVKDCQTSEVTSKSGSKGWHYVMRVEYRFFAPDGSNIVALTVGESLDYGDKGANKAMTSAYKWALTQVFCIRIKDADLDTESHSPEVAAARPQRADPGDHVDDRVAAEKARKSAAKGDEPPDVVAGRAEIGQRLLALTNGDKTLAADYLESITTFQGDKGQVPGKRSCQRFGPDGKPGLSAKQVALYRKGGAAHWKITEGPFAKWQAEAGQGPGARQPGEEAPPPDEPGATEPEDDDSPFEPRASDGFPAQPPADLQVLADAVQTMLALIGAGLGETPAECWARMYERVWPLPVRPWDVAIIDKAGLRKFYTVLRDELIAAEDVLTL
ncbi:MAG: ERF family protein [Chloroflexi bacterium]|nr:ERF family protein [Chloroflexota bacterium]